MARRWRAAPPGSKRGHRRARDSPHWAAMHPEFKRKHVTLTILWDEYVAASPTGGRRRERTEKMSSERPMRPKPAPGGFDPSA